MEEETRVLPVARVKNSLGKEASSIFFDKEKAFS
jgi:hypothetical protein